MAGKGEQAPRAAQNRDRPAMKHVAINGHNHYRFDGIVSLAWLDPPTVLYLPVRELAYYPSARYRENRRAAHFLPAHPSLYEIARFRKFLPREVCCAAIGVITVSEPGTSF